jgi:thiamine pyrophosphokinase
VRALIITNGAGGARGQLRLLARSVQLIVAADGGAEAAARAGVRPHLLVGDLDSIGAATRARLVRAGVEVRAVPAAKDLTDAELALGVARERGATDVTLTAALGGRVDHAIANLMLLVRAREMGIRLRLVAGRTEVRLAEQRTELDGAVGDLVSLIPLSETTDHITTFGLRYPLADERLLRGQTRGVSNVIAALPAGLEHRGPGDLLIVHTRRRPPRASRRPTA